MTLVWQDIVVTLVSAGAAAMLVQRVVGLVRPRRRTTPSCDACDRCASGPRQSSRPV